MNGHIGIIDLFSGIGGFSLGAIRAGFNVLVAVDNDARVAKVFNTNFPGFKFIQEDIEHITADRLLSTASISSGTVHGIIGGPPCQGFSRIGRREPTDQRNILFDHFFRLVSEIQPWFYVAENVVGILDSPFENMRAKAFERLDRYRILPPFILNSSDFGAATNRKRVFFVGYKPEYFRELNEINFNPSKISKKITVGVALKGLRRKINPIWQKESQGWRQITKREKGEFWDLIYGTIPEGVGNAEAIRRLRIEGRVSGCLGTKHTDNVLQRFLNLKQGEIDGPSRAIRLEKNGLCPTLRSGTGPEHGSFQALRPIHPLEPRVITPREAARLQGFPDWFLFDTTKWHSFRQIGNSVSPILAQGVMQVISAHILREEKCDGK